MSLAILKSWIFPQHHSKKHYSALPTSSSLSSSSLRNSYNGEDTECGCSQSSDAASSHCINEKTRYEPTTKPIVSPRTVADATIGLSDGLTVPFALTAGLSALGDTNVVIYGGLAELIAGSISMGLGGYLGARSEAAGYRAANAEARRIVAGRPEQAVELVEGAFAEYDLPGQAVNNISSALLAKPESMIGFLMKFHYGLEEDEFTHSRALKCGGTIAAGYFFGGLVPLLPYLLFTSMRTAFLGSVVIMVVALFAFGWIKTALLAEKDRMVCLKNGVQMVVMGSLAAAAAVGCVKAVGG